MTYRQGVVIIAVSIQTVVKLNTNGADTMTYGYCRISTKKQNIERQERNIKATYPEALIRKEVYTGTKSDRKEWSKLLKALKPADTVVFDSVSRMSRNAEEGF